MAVNVKVNVVTFFSEEDPWGTAGSLSLKKLVQSSFMTQMKDASTQVTSGFHQDEHQQQNMKY